MERWEVEMEGSGVPGLAIQASIATNKVEDEDQQERLYSDPHLMHTHTH